MMEQFVKLYSALDETSNEDQKVDALIQFFTNALEEDKIWALALLTGKRPTRIVTIANLQTWTAQITGYPDWLFNESVQLVGDPTETCALLISSSSKTKDRPISSWLKKINQLKEEGITEKEQAIKLAWVDLSEKGRWVFNKLITGSFRLDLNQSVLVRAIAVVTDKKRHQIAHRISSTWKPEKTTFSSLCLDDNAIDDLSEHYDFMPLSEVKIIEKSVDLGAIANWQIERTWPGLRCQLVIRKGHVFLWSKQGDLLTSRFPELIDLSEHIDDAVIDGMIIVWGEEEKPSFPFLQKRIGRKRVTKNTLKELPAAFVAMDVLEWKAEDITQENTDARRVILEGIIAKSSARELLLSEVVSVDSWEKAEEEVQKLHQVKCDALLLKHKFEPYTTESPYWKWKAEKHSAKAVLLYATKGEGGSSGYSDITLGVWFKKELVPLAKVNLEIGDQEKSEIASFINKNTLERFGPVRVINPTLVFEITYDAVYHSARKKSGLSLRNPQLSLWLKDENVDAISTLNEIKKNI